MNCTQCKEPVIITSTDMVDSDGYNDEPAVLVEYYYCANTKCEWHCHPMRCHQLKFN